ncbi:MAG TPA: hypothetical protein PKD64_06495 [Pirellulaceae bacterium]|nr:hypothetical protein [Pirellulaceae bacterium]HMO91831.1 hypothetical protein [Pirellulaceae bacterium]HMP69894.1 hypothetical protein [Pirellulaceae bacterium]
MHASQLAVLGAWIAGRADEIALDNQISLENQIDYWVNNKARFDRWHRTLKVFHSDITYPQPLHDPWPAISLVVEEIVVSELLTRVWGAVLNQQSISKGVSDFAGIAKGSLVGHVEVRNRAIHLLLRANDDAVPVVTQLHKYVNRIERWTDLWLSLFPNVEQAAEFAFVADRVQDFKFDEEQSALDVHVDAVSKSQQANLMLSSFARSIENVRPRAANPDLNQRIADSVLTALPSQIQVMNYFAAANRRYAAEQSCLDAERLISELLTI